jgi:CRP-like cAMP-binding protein
MTGLLTRSEPEAFSPVIRKLRNLAGAESDGEAEALVKRIKVKARRSRGEDIVGPGNASRYLTVLLDGVASSYERLTDGNRQIYAFQYPGDFCDLARHVLPESNDEVVVAALTDCSIGIIEHRDLEQLIAQHPSLGLALWRATMLEASIFRKRLLNVGRQPALQRVAHLLCEHLARCEAVGINSPTIPLTQVDLADAVGLSIVHINRTVQELRRLGILSTKGRAIEVVNRAKLATLAGFDGQYLNMPQVLSQWQIRIDRDPMPTAKTFGVTLPSLLVALAAGVID